MNMEGKTVCWFCTVAAGWHHSKKGGRFRSALHAGKVYFMIFFYFIFWVIQILRVKAANVWSRSVRALLWNEPVIYLLQLRLEEPVSWVTGFAAAQMPLAKARFKSGAAGKCRKFHSAQLILCPYCLALEIRRTGSPCFLSAGGRLKLCPVQIQHCAKTQSFPMRPVPSLQPNIRYRSQILFFFVLILLCLRMILYFLICKSNVDC